jgi:hypothetical protein
MTTLAVSPFERVGRVTRRRVVLSEWTKFGSLRSTHWSLLAAVVLTVGLPALFAAILAARWGHMSLRERGGHRHQPVNVALDGGAIGEWWGGRVALAWARASASSQPRPSVRPRVRDAELGQPP